MRQAKQLRFPIVDSDIEHQLLFSEGSSSAGSSSSSSKNNNTGDSGSSSSPEDDDSKDGGVYVSGGYTASAAGSDASSSFDYSPEPQPQPKKYLCTALHRQGGQVLDVDAMSTDGCPVHMVGEGEYNIHSSNWGQVFFSFLHVALLRSGILVDNIALSQRRKFQLIIAWKFSKLPRKMLRSFGSQVVTQSATNIAWNVLWTLQATIPG